MYTLIGESDKNHRARLTIRVMTKRGECHADNNQELRETAAAELLEMSGRCGWCGWRGWRRSLGEMVNSNMEDKKEAGM